MDDPSLARAVEQVAANPGFLAELRNILDEADADARRQGLECLACGKCCLFGQFGHRLYVTTGELALLRMAGGAVADKPSDGRCPHYNAGRCTARGARALGCRLFYCDPAGQRWFPDAYERFHQCIKRLHERHGVPYFYVDFSR